VEAIEQARDFFFWHTRTGIAYRQLTALPTSRSDTSPIDSAADVSGGS
jgi:hypothetical protein